MNYSTVCVDSVLRGVCSARGMLFCGEQGYSDHCLYRQVDKVYTYCLCTILSQPLKC